MGNFLAKVLHKVPRHPLPQNFGFTFGKVYVFLFLNMVLVEHVDYDEEAHYKCSELLRLIVEEGNRGCSMARHHALYLFAGYCSLTFPKEEGEISGETDARVLAVACAKHALDVWDVQPSHRKLVAPVILHANMKKEWLSPKRLRDAEKHILESVGSPLVPRSPENIFPEECARIARGMLLNHGQTMRLAAASRDVYTILESMPRVLYDFEGKDIALACIIVAASIAGFRDQMRFLLVTKTKWLYYSGTCQDMNEKIQSCLLERLETVERLLAAER